MTKLLYPIYKLPQRTYERNIPTWIKYWLYTKSFIENVMELSEILTGSEFTLLNTIIKKFKIFELSGGTEQTQLSGKNILNATAESYTLPATSTTYQDIVTQANKPYLEAGTKYYISYNIENASTSNTRSTPRLYLNSEYVQYASTNANLTAGRKVWEFTPSVSGNYELQYWLQGSNVAVTVSQFMISTSSDTTYEPYCGRNTSTQSILCNTS